MKIEEIKDFLKNYAEHIIENNRLDEMLYETASKEEWFELQSKRSARLREMFVYNSEKLKELLKVLDDPDAVKESADALLEGTLLLYNDEAEDYYLLLELVKKLLPIYLEQNNVEAIIRLCMIGDYEHKVYVQGLIPKRMWDTPYPYAEIVRELSERYGANLSEKARRQILYNYFNMAVVVPSGQPYIEAKSYDILKEMLAFMHSPKVTEVGDEEFLAELEDDVVNAWIAEAWLCWDLSDEAKEFLNERISENCEEMQEELESEDGLETEICFAYISWQLHRNSITPDEAIKMLYQNFVKRSTYLATVLEKEGKQFLSAISESAVELAELLTNIITRLCHVMEEYHLDPADYQDILSEISPWYIKYWKFFSRSSSNAFFDDVLSGDFLKLLQYTSDDEARMKLFDVVLMRRYIFNFIHFEMVASLAVKIAEQILQEKPEIFKGVFGYTEEEVREHKDELLGFIALAAKYHDVGKIHIGKVIETQFRKITDAEFAGIKEHPTYGAEIAERLPFLKPYKDVILGHHKFYNGQGGYPVSYDNTLSPLRPVVDLITICDCLDAATDRLGRNYASTKTVDEVLGEFERDKGVRYNPEIVDYIRGNKELITTLNYLVDDGRKEICYRIFEEQSLR